MSGNILTVGATAVCPHGGSITIVSTNSRVRIEGQPVATLGDTFTVASCTFSLPGPKPQPCVLVRWLQPAGKIRVNGQPVVLQTSSGICQSAEQIPQGPPQIVKTQIKVRGR